MLFLNTVRVNCSFLGRYLVNGDTKAGHRWLEYWPVPEWLVFWMNVWQSKRKLWVERQISYMETFHPLGMHGGRRLDFLAKSSWQAATYSPEHDWTHSYSWGAVWYFNCRTLCHPVVKIVFPPHHVKSHLEKLLLNQPGCPIRWCCHSSGSSCYHKAWDWQTRAWSFSVLNALGEIAKGWMQKKPFMPSFTDPPIPYRCKLSLLYSNVVDSWLIKTYAPPDDLCSLAFSDWGKRLQGS